MERTIEKNVEMATKLLGLLGRANFDYYNEDGSINKTQFKFSFLCTLWIKGIIPTIDEHSFAEQHLPDYYSSQDVFMLDLCQRYLDGELQDSNDIYDVKEWCESVDSDKIKAKLESKENELFFESLEGFLDMSLFNFLKKI